MAQVHTPSQGIVRFDSFEVNLRAGELRKQGAKVKLQEQPFQILCILLECSGELVTRESLRERIWPSDTFVDFDHGLNNGIKRLREALCDSAETPRYIETLPKRGYRFIGEVHPVNGSKDIPAKAATEESAAQKRSSGRLGRLAMISGGALLLVSLLAIVLSNSSLWDRLTGKADARRIGSLAVLPLQNLSNDPDQEYFADGMTDALITDLAQTRSLKVISRTSVMPYKKTQKNLSQIARELRVDGLVEGTVQRAGSRVRVTAQLIHVPSDRHLWARSYEGELRDVLALEDSLATSIAQEIRAQLTTTDQRAALKRTTNLNALEAYLQGQYHHEGIADGLLGVNGKLPEYEQQLDNAIAYFQTAVREDPNYASAYLAMAEIWAQAKSSMGGSPRAQLRGCREGQSRSREGPGTRSLPSGSACASRLVCFHDRLGLADCRKRVQEGH
jgi:TolB-like protein/DNA-binding winged helix-turn-helix (wHTH) protein